MKSNKSFSAHHISTAEVFATTKFAANADNSLYFVGADTATTYVGVPDIKYEDYCIIKPYGYTYTHGRFNVQSIQSADATHMGLADALEVKNALNTVAQSAAQGLKCVDLTTYQGTTVGEIVKHIGATTANYVNGYDYKYNSATSSVSTTLTDIDVSLSNLVPTSQATASAWTSLRTPFYINNRFDEEDSNEYYLIFYADSESIDDKGAVMVGYNLDIENPTVQVGDWVYVYDNFDAPYIPDQVVSVNGTKFTTESGRVYDTTSFDYNSYFSWLINEDGEEVVICGSPMYDDGATATNNFIYPKLHLSDRVTFTVTRYDPAITVTITSTTTTSSWVQTNAQPPVELEYDIEPTANSNNLVNSGNIKKAIDIAPRFYLGTCSTAGNVAIKQVDIPNFPTQLVNGVETPIVGSVIAVKFSNTDEAASAQKKIKVNNTSAYSVWYGASETSDVANVTAHGVAGRCVYYVFNGTHWVWISQSFDNNNTYTPQSLGFGYGYCDTAAATAAKTASLSSYNLINGGLVVVYFQYDVPAQATLNINNKGAKEIHFGSSRIAAGVIKAGDKCLFIYNGNYALIAIDRWGKELQEKVSGINISETDFEALSTYEQGKLYFVYDDNNNS